VPSSLNIFVAFAAGLISFLSPCVLPLVPAYIGYLSGPAVMSAASTAGGGRREAAMTMTASSARWKVFAHSALFVLGFTIIFVVVIGGLAGTFSDLLREHKRAVQYVMGVMLVIFGLFMLHMVNIPLLNYTRRADTAMRSTAGNLGYLRSLLIGMGFAIGWTPCIGPTLGLMFTLAMNNSQAEAFPLFLSYSLGLGIPFLLAGFAMGQISSGLKKLTRRTYSLKIGAWKVVDQVDIVSLVSGVLLVVVGIMVFTNSLTIINQYFPTFGI
jgi:cytochrome c-type biogenesis protein